MLVLPASTWKGTVAFQRVIKAVTALGMQQKLPAQVLSGFMGIPSSRTIAPHSAHPLGCGTGNGQQGWERQGPSAPARSLGPSAPGRGWHHPAPASSYT